MVCCCSCRMCRCNSSPARSEPEQALALKPEPCHKQGAAEEDRFEAAFAALRVWVDTGADDKSALLHARREARAGRPALALRALAKARFRGCSSCACVIMTT